MQILRKPRRLYTTLTVSFTNGYLLKASDTRDYVSFGDEFAMQPALFKSVMRAIDTQGPTRSNFDSLVRAEIIARAQKTLSLWCKGRLYSRRPFRQPWTLEGGWSTDGHISFRKDEVPGHIRWKAEYTDRSNEPYPLLGFSPTKLWLAEYFQIAGFAGVRGDTIEYQSGADTLILSAELSPHRTVRANDPWGPALCPDGSVVACVYGRAAPSRRIHIESGNIV